MVVETALHPHFFNKPTFVLERRLEHLRKLKEVYEMKLREIEIEINEIEALLEHRSYSNEKDSLQGTNALEV